MLIKYLFKYVNKGSDRARLALQQDANDEILTYLNCRYISPYEAVWRLFQYSIHHREPSVERLPVHLPLEQNIVFSGDQSLRSIIKQNASNHTMLTSWFETNKIYSEARSLTYAQFPSKFLYDTREKMWKPRKQKGSIGRIAYVHPASGELYYLRMLLNLKKGALNFDDLKTVNGIVHPSYHDACQSLGLLGDDKEWIEALSSAVNVASSPQLRQLFVTIILYCDVVDPKTLFDSHWLNMYDDILYSLRKTFAIPDMIIPQDELKNSVLFELELLFNNASSSLAKYHLPMPDARKMLEIKNKLLREELNYDCEELSKKHANLKLQLNQDQKLIYDCVIDVVERKKRWFVFCLWSWRHWKNFLMGCYHK